MNQRKPNLGKAARYLHDRQAKGLPLPPTMRRGTPEYVKSSYWQTLNQRCSNGAHRVHSSRNESYSKKDVKLLLTREDFIKWVDENWEKFDSMYKSGKTPSIDRIDNALGYSVDNMMVIDLKENMRKDRVKPVTGVHMSTFEKIHYECAKDAEVDGFDSKLISRSARKGMNHKGYSWRFD